MTTLTPKQALSGKKTFYAKKWQQNGYYPIDKMVWNEEHQAWERFEKKTNGWLSHGCAYEKPIKSLTGEINNYTWWLYIYEHNGYILSDTEMVNNNKFNEE